LCSNDFIRSIGKNDLRKEVAILNVQYQFISKPILKFSLPKFKPSNENSLYSPIVTSLTSAFKNNNMKLQIHDTHNIGILDNLRPDLIIRFTDSKIPVANDIELIGFFIEIKTDILVSNSCNSTHSKQLLNYGITFLKTYHARNFIVCVLMSQNIYHVFFVYRFMGKIVSSNVGNAVKFEWSMSNQNMKNLLSLFGTEFNWFGEIRIPSQLINPIENNVLLNNTSKESIIIRKEFLGYGSSGEVWAYRNISSDEIFFAVKMFYSHCEKYFNIERNLYIRLNQYNNSLNLNFPFLKMIAYDLNRLIIFLSPVGSHVESIDSLGKNGIKNVKMILACLKQIGIVHRDLRPENFVTVGSGLERRFLLIDFSCSVDENTEADCMGTLKYASDNVLKDWITTQKHRYTHADDCCSVAKMYLACWDTNIKRSLNSPVIFLNQLDYAANLQTVWNELYSRMPTTKNLMNAAKKGNIDDVCRLLKRFIKK
jgi:hypothetical protein